MQVMKAALGFSGRCWLLNSASEPRSGRTGAGSAALCCAQVQEEVVPEAGSCGKCCDQSSASRQTRSLDEIVTEKSSYKTREEPT